MRSRPHLFPAALASVMQARRVNQVALAKRSGVAVSRINNYLQGNYRTVSPGHLGAIVRCLASKPADTAALVEAYLFELVPEPVRGLVEVRVPGAKQGARWAVPAKGLPVEFAEAFRDLYRLCVNQPKVRQRTTEWISMMRETTTGGSSRVST